MQLLANRKATTPALSYADTKNLRYSISKMHIVSAEQQWNETYNARSESEQRAIEFMLGAAAEEFRNRHKYNSFKDLQLAEAKSVCMADFSINASMQRPLDIKWVLNIVIQFAAHRVMPIHVYKHDESGKYLAWDGMHTYVALWLIATQIFNEDVNDITIPANVYQSDLTAEIRENFVVLNTTAGKKQLDAFDIWEQQLYGVRIDKSTNPAWVEAERKQQIIEKHGLFVTAKKLGNDHEAGAISRLQEINKLSVDTIKNLMQYLELVGGAMRPIDEKEMVMMANFFNRARLERIDITDEYIAEIADAAMTLWNADFRHTGKFWAKASTAYYNWHINSGTTARGRFSKESVHGTPFLIAQLTISCPHLSLPVANSNSEFSPAIADLF